MSSTPKFAFLHVSNYSLFLINDSFETSCQYQPLHTYICLLSLEAEKCELFLKEHQYDKITGSLGIPALLLATQR